MKFKIHLTPFLFISLLNNTALPADPNCPNLHSAVQIALIQKGNLEKKQEQLEGQFKKHLERDIDAQADGLFDNFHRNAAKKVFFAKKKLSAAIEKKRKSIESMTSFYCEKCPPSEENREDYCKACEESSLCGAKDL